MQTQTLREMVKQLLQKHDFNLSIIARKIGVHEETIYKLCNDDRFRLMPRKELALIKLYCAEAKTST